MKKFRVALDLDEKFDEHIEAYSKEEAEYEARESFMFDIERNPCRWIKLSRCEKVDNDD